MSENDNQWAWFSEEDPIPALLRPEPSNSKSDPVGLRLDIMPLDAAKTPAGSASLGKAVALHLEGKTHAALKERLSAIEGGENLSELHSATRHIQFELQQLAQAAKSYAKAAQADPKHKTASYNQGVCLERSERFKEAGEALQRAL